jgi:hypothetical protein
MMIAYMDESGTHDQSQAVVVGGLVAKTHAWSRFIRTWGNCLTTSRASNYHASVLESRLGEYQGWSQARKVNLQKEMIAAVRKATSYGVACGLSLADYSAVVPEDLGTPYMLCVAGAVIKVVEWAQGLGYSQPIAFVFEAGGPQAGEVSKYFDDRRKRYPLIGPLTFANKGVLPLQAADFYTYEAWKYFENNIVNGEQRDIRKSLQAIIGLPNMDAWAYDREGLTDLVTQYRALTAAPQIT